MTLSIERLAAAGAALIAAFYLIDVPRLVIEIWGLPLPLLGGQPPYMLPLAAIVALALACSAGGPGGARLARPADGAFACAVAILACLEILHGMDGGERSWDLVVQLLVFYSGYLLARAFVDFFASAQALRASLFWAIVAIVCVHAVLLVFHRYGLPPLGARPEEFVSRNGISFLAVFACFLVWFPNAGERIGPAPPVLAGVMPVLAVGHMMLNAARGALVALVLLAVVRFVLRGDRSVWGARAGLVLALAVLAAVALAASISDGLSSAGLLGVGDDRLSANVRLETNQALLGAFLHAPLVGIGAADVADIRVGGYMSHTLPLLFLAAYGVFGVMPLLLALGILARDGQGSSPAGTVALVLLVGVTVSVNDLWPWLAVALVSASAARRGLGRTPRPTAAMGTA